MGGGAALLGGAAPGKATATKQRYSTFDAEPERLVLPKVESVSWLSRFTYTHARPLLDEGSKRRLELDDLWELEAPYRAQVAYAPFKRAYLERQQSLKSALMATVGGKFFLCGVGAGVRAACALFAPIVLRQVIDAFSAETLDLTRVYYWVGAFFASRVVNAFVEAHANFLMEMTLLQMTVSLKALVFEKLMRRSLQSKTTTHNVNVSNVVTADIDNLMWSGYSLNSVWIMPIQVGVVIYLLYDVLGVAAFAGLGVVVLSILVNNAVAAKSKQSFDQVMKLKDRRMGVVKEVFNAIQVVKLNAWEDQFMDKINVWRQLELGAVARYLYVVATSVFLLWSAPLVVSVVSFATYALVLGQQLTAANVFTSMVLFNAIRDPLSQFPGAVQTILQAHTALGRIATFLKTEEAESERRVAHETAKHGPSIEIAMDKASFSWQGKQSSEHRTVLEDVSLKVNKGDFVVVHGAVGSGKSSLLAAMLGELPTEKGSVFVRSSSVAYYSQQPWIQNMTIRDNILFGLPYDKTKYDNVIDACGLVKDIGMFPAGDMTEIGQKGVNLSGGQKARISLARACYSDADVLILDSPLAAVDAIVQAEIFNKCLCGLLEKKTVVLVTHLQDVIESKAVTVKVHVTHGHVKVTHFDRKKARHQYAKLHAKRPPSERDMIDADDKTPPHKADGTLIEQEGRQGGLVSGRVFKLYSQAMGGTRMLVSFLLILAGWQSFQIASDFWLSRWTGGRPVDEPVDSTGDEKLGLTAVQFNLMVYALLGLGASVFVLLRALTVAFVGVRAAKKLFDDMTASLLRAPLRFFDANPIGRIINRYAEDISMIDFRLPPVFFGAFVASAMVAFQLLAAVAVIQWAGGLVLPLCWVYVRLGGFYFTANLEVSRLRKVTTSPVLSHIAESEDGVATLRAFGADYVGRALQQHWTRVDDNSRAWYAQTVISQWFALRVQLIGVGVVVVVVSSLLAFHEFLSPGLIGVAFMYAMNVDQQLALGLKSWLWLEMYLVSPERVLEYVDLPTEGHINDQLVVLSSNRQPWPQRGSIVFENVKFAYKPGGDVVLKGLSFEVKHNEKIGIVGRTGAGKSSLALALFRINELESGRILVDGVDISTVHLRTLRSRLSIIPQAPVLFQGSMRAYMDPFEEYSDGEIWSAFDKVGIKALVGSLEGKLHHQLSENGDNFSVGERQLLCLARALLCRSRVIVMDEATSSIDRVTEKKLQAMIQREFKDATVLTIAHRLSTVLESDRIMVLSDGRVVEFDTAEALVQHETGAFRALAKESGHLRQLLKHIEPESATKDAKDGSTK